MLGSQLQGLGHGTAHRLLSHGWPLSADDWDGQMLFFGQRGYRVIAHDRRGHGRSSQTWDGNEMDTYADDLRRCSKALDLKDAIMVGHSTGGGEVARYLGRHGAKRVAKAVLISAVPPLMLKTEKNPGGLPISVFDGLRAALAANRPQFYKDITLPFYGYNRPGAKISEGIREHWWLQGMMGGMKAHYDCIKAFSETDFTEDLKKIDIPVLVMHGDDDQIVPIGAAGLLSAKILKNATLKVYPGFPHGMPATNADQINADLLAFFNKTKAAIETRQWPVFSRLIDCLAVSFSRRPADYSSPRTLPGLRSRGCRPCPCRPRCPPRPPA
jgi:non-heme chloroperoxidase